MAVAFSANYGGDPPRPFRPFPSGERVFYLVGVETAEGAPAPAGQLSVNSKTTKGTGRYPVDTVTETATGTLGRRRVTVATRTYSWERYTRGAKAAARDAARWTGRSGETLTMWSYVVSCAEAEAMGYAVPSGSTVARPGSRGTGHENAQRGSLRGRSIVATPEPLRQPAPQTPAQTPAPAPAGVTGFAGLNAETGGTAEAIRDARRPTPSWVASFSDQPEARRERARAIAARNAAAVANVQRLREERETPPAPAMVGETGHWLSQDRMHAVLGEIAEPIEAEQSEDAPAAGAGRFAGLEID